MRERENNIHFHWAIERDRGDISFLLILFCFSVSLVLSLSISPFLYVPPVSLSLTHPTSLHFCISLPPSLILFTNFSFSFFLFSFSLSRVQYLFPFRIWVELPDRNSIRFCLRFFLFVIQFISVSPWYWILSLLSFLVTFLSVLGNIISDFSLFFVYWFVWWYFSRVLVLVFFFFAVSFFLQCLRAVYSVYLSVLYTCKLSLGEFWSALGGCSIRCVCSIVMVLVGKLLFFSHDLWIVLVCFFLILVFFFFGI